MDLGFMLIAFIFINVLVTSIAFIFKVPVSIWNFIVSSLLTLGMYVVIMRKHKYKVIEIAVCFGLFILSISGSMLLASNEYDISWDGNMYHKIAIGELSEGWNPIYQSIDDFNEEAEIKLSSTAAIWNDHYPKATWIFGANIYKVTGNIESGKCITFLMILATFLISYSFFNLKNKATNYILASLLALNPIILCQIGTFYIDGILGNYLILLILSLSIMGNKKLKVNRLENCILYFMILSIIINLKFTGFAYAGIYSLFYYIYFLIDKKLRELNFKSLTITAVCALIIGVGVIGWSTYPKNFMEHGNPFYPLYGNDAVDIMESNTPTDFLSMNRIKRFIVSNLSRSGNGSNNGLKSYEIKMPLSFSQNELMVFISPDVRVAGYGVLFGGVLLISFGAMCYYFYKNKFNHKDTLILMLIPILVTGLIVLVIKESWWARYLPQLYLVPTIVVIMMSYIKGNASKFLNNLIVFALIVNSYILLNVIHENRSFGRESVDAQFAEVYDAFKDEDIKISSDIFSGAVFNVLDKLPKAKIIDNTCDEQDTLQLMNGKVCVYSDDEDKDENEEKSE